MIFRTGDCRRETEQHSRGNSEKRRARELADGPYLARGAMASGVRCAAAFFATEAQGRAHQDETREIIYENTRLQVVSEGKPHLGRALDGGFRCAASPVRRVIGRFPKAFSGI